MVDGVLLPVDTVEGPMPHRRPVTCKALAQGLKPITVKLTRAPGNGADIGGLKVVTAGGWFAVRPSGTEDVCKIYAESLRGEDHLKQIQEEAWQIVQAVFAAAQS